MNKTLQDRLIPGYVIPVDGIKTVYVVQSFSDVTLGIIWSFAILATLLALWFLFTNIKHRKRM